MSTRNDVAKLAGVSPAVVSYVVNNSNYVSQEKRQAVLKAIEELGYYPNSLARSLKSGKSRQFLLITDDIRNEMFSEVTYYMEPEAYEAGYSLTVSSCTQKSYGELLDTLNGRQYAGAFIFSGVVPLNEKCVGKLNQLAASGIPIVLFMFIKNTIPLHPSITVLRPNIREAVCKAVDYLLEKGRHQIVGYLGDGDPKAGGESGPFGDGLRINGYLDSLEKHHIRPQKNYIFFMEEFQYPSRTFMNVEGVIESYFSMKEEERPTAYFVNSDMMAAKLITRFLSRKIRIPETVEIVGFGDTSSASIVAPQLTTVAMPCQVIGESAIHLLMRKVAGEETRDEFFELQMIKRDSA